MTKLVKNKKMISILMSAFLILLLSACATPIENANASFQNGNYEAAIYYSIKALNDDPSSQDARYIIKESWKIESMRKQNEIISLLNKNTIDSLEKADSVYSSYLKLSMSVKSARINDIYPIPNINQIENDKSKAANILNLKYIEKGKDYLVLNDRENAKIACSYFEKAKNNGYYSPELNTLIKQAEDAATIVVYVTSAEDYLYTQMGGHPYESSSLEKPIAETLDKQKYIKVISDYLYMPSDFDNNFQTKKHAKEVGATHLLHFRPLTNYNFVSSFSREPFIDTNWTKEDISINSDIKIDFIYQLINLETNEIELSGTYTYENSNDDDFKISGILSDGNTAILDYGLGEFTGNKKVLANKTNTYLNDSYALFLKLSRQKGINITSTFFEQTMNIEPILASGTNEIDLNDYQTTKDLTKINGFNNHIFFTFDAIEFAPILESETNEYKFIYTNILKANTNNAIDDYLKASKYEKELYYDIKEWVKNPNTKKNMFNDLIENDYLNLAPREFATSIANSL